MDKYTDLEQALRDPSLAIITDSITKYTELNKVFTRYRNGSLTITPTNSWVTRYRKGMTLSKGE